MMKKLTTTLGAEVNPELTPYQLWQLDRYGDYIPAVQPKGSYEVYLEDEDRFREWTELQAEIQLREEDHL